MGTVFAVPFPMPDFATLKTTGPVLPDLNSYLFPSIGNRSINAGAEATAAVAGAEGHGRVASSPDPEVAADRQLERYGE